MPDIAVRDANRVPSLIGVDSDTFLVPTTVAVNATTHALLVEGGGGGTQYTDGDAAATHPIGTGIIFNDAGTYTFVSDSNPLPVSASFSPSGTQDVNITKVGGNAVTTTVPVSGTVAATQSGTWVLGANSGVDIGDVTINNASGAAAVNIQDGGNTITVDGTVSITANSSVNVSQMNGVTVTMGNGASGTGVQRVTLASDSTGNIATIGTSITPGTAAANLGKAEDAAHSSGDTGVFALGVRNATLAAFTSADGDYSPLATGSAGEAIVSLAPFEARTSGTGTTTGTSGVSVISAPGANIFLYITDIIIANTGSSTSLITLQLDPAGTPSTLGYTIAPAGGGSNLHFSTPLKVTTANKAFGFTAGTASTTIYMTAIGFTAKV